MAHRVTVLVLFVLRIPLTGLTALIQTQQTVVAAVGEEACFSCLLTQPKDVLQVTWQKVLRQGEQNVASYNKYFGSRVNSGFRDKVRVKAAGLQNCSLIIRELMEQDEGCYLCMFNTYPDGALTGRTCLQLYELHEPVLHVGESNSSRDLVVSCSATGRPAPTLTLSATQLDLDFSRNNTVTVNNSNGTVTVNTTAVLSRFHYDSIQVSCAVQVLSGQKQLFRMVDGVKRLTAADGEKDFAVIITLSVVVFCACVAVVIIVLLKLKQRNSQSSMSKTPPRPKEDIHEVRTPLFKQENETVTTASSLKRRNHSMPLTMTPKRLFETPDT